MQFHNLTRVKGYVGKSGRYIYECTSCRCTVEGWNLPEARKQHAQDLTPIKNQEQYPGYLYK